MTISKHDKFVHTHVELERRIRRLVERQHAEGAQTNKVTIRHAAELDPAERVKYGLPADWTPREPTSKRRGRR